MVADVGAKGFAADEGTKTTFGAELNAACAREEEAGVAAREDAGTGAGTGEGAGEGGVGNWKRNTSFKEA